MEEKKTIKVSLGTVICITIIILLLVVIIGMWYYFKYVKKSNRNEEQQNIIEANNTTQNINNNEDVNVIALKPSKTISTLFNNGMEAEQYIVSLWDENNTMPSIEFYEKEVAAGDEIVGGMQSEYVASSTYKNYNVDNLGDFFIDKCWCEGVIGNGIGETIEINTFASCEKVEWYNYNSKKRSMTSLEDTIDYLLTDFNDDPGRAERIQITKDNISNYYSGVKQIAIINGYAKEDALWRNNNRVKKMKLTIDDTKQYILELEDSKDLQLFDVNYKNDNITKKINMKFEILEVYSGEKYDDTYITSIYLSEESNVPWGGR